MALPIEQVTPVSPVTSAVFRDNPAGKSLVDKQASTLITVPADTFLCRSSRNFAMPTGVSSSALTA